MTDVDKHGVVHSDLVDQPIDQRADLGPAPSADHDASEGERLERTGRRWLIWSFILCPCHLPWTLAILAAVFGGSTIGVLVNQYRTVVGVAIAVIYFIGVAIGFSYLRKAKASGACNVRF